MTLEYEVDLRFISLEEAVQYVRDLRGRDRVNHRRIQAWFDHCARIRSHPSSLISHAVTVECGDLRMPQSRM